MPVGARLSAISRSSAAVKSTIEELGPTRVRMAIEVPWGDLDHAFGEVYKELGQQVRVPGFRPGKVPNRVLDQRIGRPVVLQQVVQHAIPEVYSGDLMEGLDDAVRGLSAEGTATFTTPLRAGEHAGEEAEVTVTVRSVKSKDLPELDDEFASTASEFDTLDELREDVRTRLKR